MNILYIIEDEYRTAIPLRLRGMMKDLGHDVTLIGLGNFAAKGKTEAPDLIVCSCQIPGVVVDSTGWGIFNPIGEDSLSTGRKALPVFFSPKARYIYAAVEKWTDQLFEKSADDGTSGQRAADLSIRKMKEKSFPLFCSR